MLWICHICFHQNDIFQQFFDIANKKNFKFIKGMAYLEKGKDDENIKKLADVKNLLLNFIIGYISSKDYLTNINNLDYYKRVLTEGIPNISKSDLNRNINMTKEIQIRESSLLLLPNLSKWNTKVKNMSHMFDSCTKLSSLPDISKWNTENVIDMSFIFSNCNSLKNLPNI